MDRKNPFFPERSQEIIQIAKSSACAELDRWIFCPIIMTSVKFYLFWDTFKYLDFKRSLDSMKRTFSKAFVLLIFALLGFSGINVTSASDRTVWASIKEAYYTDLDGDGQSDDVFLGVQVDFLNFGKSDFINGIEYSILIGLVLPSGKEFWYQLQDTDHRPTLYLSFHLLNHATENGWYEAYSAGAYREVRVDRPILAHYVIFDPPGGQHGGIPTIDVFKS